MLNPTPKTLHAATVFHVH